MVHKVLNSPRDPINDIGMKFIFHRISCFKSEAHNWIRLRKEVENKELRDIEANIGLLLNPKFPLYFSASHLGKIKDMGERKNRILHS